MQPNLPLATGIVILAGLALQKSIFPPVSAGLVVAALAALWIAYSAAAAKLIGGNFQDALLKRLAADGLTYIPMALPFLAKAALDAAGASLGYGAGQMPVMLAFGAAVAMSVAAKVAMLPVSAGIAAEGSKPTRNARTLVIAAIIAYFLFFSTITIMRHESFNSTAYDLAIFDQTTWGYSQGKILFNTVRGLNLLGDHMHPILFILAPLYKLMPMPHGLLALQSLALALGALPIYWMARKRIGNLAAAMISSSYLLYPSVQYINMFDFHPEALAMPLLLFALHYMEERKYIHMTALLVAAGMAKEHFPLAMAVFGTYVFFAHRKRAIGAALATAGIGWFVLNFKVLLPYFFGSAAYSHIRGYEYLGGTLGEAAKNLLLKPQLAIGRLLSPDSLIYAMLLLFPLGLALPVLAGIAWLLPAAPFFAINMLRSHDLTTAILYQHNAELIPFLFFAAIMGMKRLLKLLARLKASNARLAVGLLVLTSSLSAAAVYGPFAAVYDINELVPDREDAAARLLLAEIPESASVSASPTILTHLAHREQAYMFPNPFMTFMYGREFWTMSNGTEESQSRVDYVALDLSTAGPSYSSELYSTFIASFLSNSNYGLERMEGTFALFRRGAGHKAGLCRLSAYLDEREDIANSLDNESKTYLKACREAQLQ